MKAPKASVPVKCLLCISHSIIKLYFVKTVFPIVKCIPHKQINLFEFGTVLRTCT